MTGNRRKPTRKLQTLMTGSSAVALLAGVALAALAGPAAAQDATWLLNPATGDFNTGGNWTPATVPTGTAFFDTSNTTALTFSAPTTTIGGWTFNVGASDYVFTVDGYRELEFDGDGIVVNGGSAEIVIAPGMGANSNVVTFLNTSTAGAATITSNALGNLYFRDASTAGDSTINNNGLLQFRNDSTAGTSTILHNGGPLSFHDDSSAGDSNITSNASISFFNNSTAGNATISIDGNIVNFISSSTAGNATISNNSNLNFLQTTNAGTATILNNATMQFRDDSSAESSHVTNDGTLYFQEQATAGDATITNNDTLEFYGNSTAGNATITNNLLGGLAFADASTAGSAVIGNDGHMLFQDSSSADAAQIVNNSTGEIHFTDTSTAGDATIVNDNTLVFGADSTAGNAIITNNAGMGFADSSTAGDATIANNDFLNFIQDATAGSAAITNNATLRFFNTSTAGSADITNNSGLHFSNTSTAGSATITNNGSTNFNNTSTAGSATIANNLTINFHDTSNAGSATITNNAGGFLYFQAASTAGSATIINNNNLSFNGNSTAGSATITNNDTLEFFNTSTAGNATTVNNGTAVFNDSSTAGDDSNITNNLFLFFQDDSVANGIIANNFTMAFQHGSTAGNATITNEVSLDFYDASTAGSASIVNNDSLQFRDTSTAGTAVITNNDRLVFGHSSTADNATITNNSFLQFSDTSTAGNAAITNNAAGLVDFSHTTGPASDGQISAGSIAGAGDIYLGSRTLTVGGNGQSTEVSGAISDCGPTGTECWTPGVGGSLVKVGTGTLTLSGVNTYTGSTSVNAGTLDVAGSLVSAVTVNSGGTLTGIGTISGLTLNTGGTLSPGNSIGTMTVVGDATFNAGSTYVVEVEAPNQADLLSVTGTATINGGAVEIVKLSPEVSYADGQTYRLITAGTLVRNGDFTLNQPFLFLTADLDYGASFVDLLLSAGGTGGDFTTVAQTFNQFQAATGLNDLEQSGDALAVYNELLFLTDANEARRAFDLSSGEIHASGQHVIDQTFGLFSRTLRQQGAAGLGGGGTGGRVYTAPLGYGPTTTAGPGVAAIDGATTSAYASNRVAQAWLAPLGGRGVIEADGNAGKLDWWTAGLAGGYEGPIDVASGEAWLGFGLGYLRSHGAVDARLSTMDADNFNIGVYGGWADGPWSVAGSLAYSASSVSTERRIVFGGIDRTAEADYWNHTIGFSGEAAYGFNVAPGTTLSPLFTLDAGWSGHGGFTETGAGALNLTGASESWTRLDTGLGVALQHVILTETGKVTLDGRLLWEHAFADVVPSQNLAFAGSPTGFEVRGPDAGRDRVRLGLGLSYEATEAMTVRAGYTGLFSGNQQSHGASLGLNVKF
ncbi:autotransporter domain-containing protein [Nitratireductor soli]|uniref:autotransporter domain-containing protein n=1 Tax=Nitratireductor soli TaxID=1670619 RepID=UPI00065E7CA1|nr:autotransporter domain-containing protein [Nitratireductor soli]